MPTARGSAANPAITSDIGWGYTELECWINFADYLDWEHQEAYIATTSLSGPLLTRIFIRSPLQVQPALCICHAAMVW